MATIEQDREWHDPTNWRGGRLNIYVCSRDERLLVPARNPHFGFTLNLGRRGTWLLLLTVLALMLVAGALSVRAAESDGDPRTASPHGLTNGAADERSL